MTARHDARLRARELRAAGLPLRAIAHEVGAALSSVSVWVRDVRLSEEQSARLGRRAWAPRPPTPQPRALPAGTKRCPRCTRDLPFSSFSRDGDGWQSWCKGCFSAYFAARREYHLATMKRGNARRRSAARRYVRELRAKSACADCGLTIPECLEFDHVGEKTEDVSRLIGNGARVERLRAEIASCEIVCACCHRRRTHRRQVERASRHAASRDLDAGRTRNRAFVQSWASLLWAARTVGSAILSSSTMTTSTRSGSTCRPWRVTASALGACSRRCSRARSGARTAIAGVTAANVRRVRHDLPRPRSSVG